MRRRHRLQKIENPFYRANARVDELERNMITAMTTVNFTAQSVIEWLWHDEIRLPLEKAYSLIDPGWYTEQNLSVPNGPIISLCIDLRNLKMACPREGLISFGGPVCPNFVTALNTMAAVHEQFEKVRKVIRWFKHSTSCAVRYYWPAMAALLPPDHYIHKVDGLRYREPVGISAILPLLRETGGIITSALLCPKAQDISAQVIVNIWKELSMSNQFSVV